MNQLTSADAVWLQHCGGICGESISIAIYRYKTPISWDISSISVAFQIICISTVAGNVFQE